MHRESIYLEKRNFDAIETKIENNIELCKNIVKLYENDVIFDESIIHIISVIEGVKPGSSFSDGRIIYDEFKLDNAHEIRNTDLYNFLVKHKIPFRVDIFGQRNSKCVTSEQGLHVIYTIARDFNTIQILPPFQHIGEYKSMVDIEREYKDSWGRFLGVPKEDCAWMEKEDFNRDFIPDLATGLEYYLELNLENISYACLVPYVPYPSEDGLKRAIDVGRKYYNAAEKFDKLMNVDYAMNEVNERILRLTYAGKISFIQSRVNKLNSEENLCYNEYISRINNKYNFDEQIIENAMKGIRIY